MQSKLYSYMHSKTVQVPVELPGIEAATDTTTQKDTWRETNKARGPERRTRPVTQGRTPLKKELRTPTVNCLGKAQFFARGTTTKTTIFCTKESTKKHDLEHDVWTKESNARRRAPKSTIFGTKESTKKHDIEPVFGTRESTKKHDFAHEGEHQKARFCARGRAPKSTILCTRESTKKHDLEHGFLHEGKHRKARFCARRKTLKTTFAQNPPAPKVLGRDLPDGTRKRLQVYLGGGGSHFSAKTSCFW